MCVQSSDEKCVNFVNRSLHAPALLREGVDFAASGSSASFVLWFSCTKP